MIGVYICLGFIILSLLFVAFSIRSILKVLELHQKHLAIHDDLLCGKPSEACLTNEKLAP